MSTFKALVASKGEAGTELAFRDFAEADLMEGDVTVRVTHSTVNYKDGLALTGRAPVVRRWPMIPGIDFAGRVESSEHPDFKPGDLVILNGWGTGETHLGAYAQKARVKGDWLVKLPAGMTGLSTAAPGVIPQPPGMPAPPGRECRARGPTPGTATGAPLPPATDPETR